MPPRIPGVQRLGTFSLCLRPAIKPATPSLLPKTQTASLSQKEKKRLAKQDPYRWAQMQQRKNAHLKRREEIDSVRTAQAGDPVRGLTTPFVESFDSAGQAPLSKPPVDDDGNPLEEPHELPTSPHILNNLIHKAEMDSAVENAYVLTQPLETAMTDVDPQLLQKAREEHDQQHAKAIEALQRITHLDKGSAKDRRHANIRRCVETFGRHETDLTLRPKALSRGQEREEQPVRGGLDTGSSEVQIAILTAKIRALANELEKGRGYRDKVGKRDLRLMVHRRQRLLRYMDRKERGSDRWQHMMETLGLSDATWKNQITL
ncbi:Uu.00g070180.m01.CDS01 [Anthostomella pinea]|uniref:Uu.00g070180.m01.CDS01 n=1 Tax=Anthostomella pinea TaxID=933095 RepID=A0AAI8VUN1_9PEZI|nr:Uu.00g070180.m01.CDS01 [Anthostomella pinea]